MRRQATIIGDGSMATVCALLLESKGLDVKMWGPFPDHIAELIQTRSNRRYLPGHAIPEGVHLTASDEQAFVGSDLIVSAVPTQYMRSVWGRLAPHLAAETPIVSVAKGIEQETLMLPTQIIADVLRAEGPDGEASANRPLAALSGPSVAGELARCLPATVCVAGEPAFAEDVQAVFTTSWFRVYTNPDLLGTELAGATKNVIALAAGILDGLQAGNNAKSALLSRGLAEITRLGAAMGAARETFFGVAGVGDLATTCFSPSGRNRTAGEMLGRGRKLAEVLDEIAGVVEGVPTTRAVVTLAQRHEIEMPITQAVAAVLFDGMDPIEGISRLMNRSAKPERVG
jgi:glycerol-3-phosphate dehydrogenase (NAD(P)+)